MSDKRSGETSPFAVVDAMVAKATRRLAGRQTAGGVDPLQVCVVVDTNSQISLSRAGMAICPHEHASSV